MAVCLPSLVLRIQAGRAGGMPDTPYQTCMVTPLAEEEALDISITEIGQKAEMFKQITPININESGG